MSRTLLKGTLSSTPVMIQVVRHGMIRLVDADNKQCWEDPHGRFLLDNREEAIKVLDAHGYELMGEKVILKAAAKELAKEANEAKATKPSKGARKEKLVEAAGEPMEAAQATLEEAAKADPTEAIVDDILSDLLGDSVESAPEAAKPAPKPRGRKKGEMA